MAGILCIERLLENTSSDSSDEQVRITESEQELIRGLLGGSSGTGTQAVAMGNMMGSISGRSIAVQSVRQKIERYYGKRRRVTASINFSSIDRMVELTFQNHDTFSPEGLSIEEIRNVEPPNSHVRGRHGQQ